MNVVFRPLLIVMQLKGELEGEFLQWSESVVFAPQD